VRQFGELNSEFPLGIFASYFSWCIFLPGKEVVQITCGEINYEGAEHRRICRVFSPNLVEDFVVINRAELREFLGPKFYIYGSAQVL